MAFQIFKRRLRQRIYIIPTAFGVLAGLLFLCGAIFASATNSSAALVLCAVLLLAGMLAIFQTNIAVSEIKMIRAHAEDVPAGMPIPLRITLMNTSRQKRYMVRVGVVTNFWRGKDTGTLVGSIQAGDSFEVLLHLPGRSRGVYTIPEISISSKFPLGVCRAWTHLSLVRDMVVYPDPSGVPHMALDPNKSSGNGTHTHDEGDFWGHRVYRPGDSFAHVDWKAQARGRGMLTKQYSYGSSLSQSIRFSDADGESVEVKLQQVSQWVHSAFERDDAYSLELPKRSLPAGHGKKQFRNAMRALAEV
jgi:uncharacterized protein (DUF58 family)